MATSVHSGGAWKTFTPYVRVAGVWQPVQSGWIHTGGVWRAWFVAYVPVSASGPGTASAGCHGVSFCTATASVTVTPSGGNGSYTYTWSRVSGSSFTIINPTSQTASFQANEATSTPGFTDSGVYKCVVSDGITSATVTVTVNLTFNAT